MGSEKAPTLYTENVAEFNYDDTAVASALAATGTWELAERSVDERSGGQRQRVWIAMALA